MFSMAFWLKHEGILNSGAEIITHYFLKRVGSCVGYRKSEIAGVKLLDISA